MWPGLSCLVSVCLFEQLANAKRDLPGNFLLLVFPPQSLLKPDDGKSGGEKDRAKPLG